MRLALLSDVHSNLVALEAVVADARTAGATHFLCAGDIVGFGPSPKEAVDAVRSLCQVVVQGNHDHALAERADSRCAPHLAPLARAAEAAAASRLAPADVEWLRRLPHEESLYLSGSQVYVVHGSPSDPLFGSVPVAPEVQRLRMEFMSVDADFVVVGHTHRPMVLRGALDGATIVNPGSVGLPADGDPRASYALLDLASGAIHPRRVPYEVAAAAAAASQALPPKERTVYEGLLRRAELR